MKKFVSVILTICLMFTISAAYAAPPGIPSTAYMHCKRPCTSGNVKHTLVHFMYSNWTEPCGLTDGCTVKYEEWHCRINAVLWRERQASPEKRELVEVSHNRNSCPLRSMRKVVFATYKR